MDRTELTPFRLFWAGGEPGGGHCTAFPAQGGAPRTDRRARACGHSPVGAQTRNPPLPILLVVDGHVESAPAVTSTADELAYDPPYAQGVFRCAARRRRPFSSDSTAHEWSEGTHSYIAYDPALKSR